MVSTDPCEYFIILLRDEPAFPSCFLTLSKFFLTRILSRRTVVFSVLTVKEKPVPPEPVWLSEESLGPWTEKCQCH